MPLSLRGLLLPLVSVLMVACQAQDMGVSARASSLEEYPECAAKCILVALTGGLCSPTDEKCICTDQTFQHNVTACVSGGCTIPDALVTQNASLTRCGAIPRDRGQELVTVTAVLASLAAVFIITRFAYKIFVTRLDLGLDDVFVLATMVSAIPSAIITKFGTVPNGLGRDIWTLTPTQITNVGKFFYIMAWLYFLQTALLKLSFVSFYMRIFPAKNVQRVLWGTFAFVTTWGLAFIITSIFQCRPVHYFWTKWDGMHKGSCADANAISWSNAAMSIALDLWILAIPLWQLRSLKMHWKKKVGVALMFCVGTFVTIVSIIRLQSLVHFAATANSTWEFYDVSLWSTIEICIGVICACLPTIRLLLVKLIPALAGSTQRSQYYRYGTGGNTSGRGRSKTATSSNHQTTVRVDSVSRAQSDHGSSEEPQGILFQKSYTVQYSDNDEASLVAMRDLEAKAPGRR
ncbi:CFEM domain-containing protein [Purpureocillium lilacinum]|uniref:CFEM domain-containing protein n=1 Tax=Purpureocillium lilacinum TaxID=33203 RepID=A0A179HX84_PURLI|nr:CFEM domain-containing protein [Purpureocillium lilacinum]OAQ93980.1 CFEM domain-containing protein [Purpureocillium lilacinum]PWI70221.1 CFEM domain-containing protein [Purpureocillium lilacinum]